MAVNILDAFLVTFGLDAKDFETGEREVRDGSKRLREDSKKTFDGMERSGKQVGAAIKSIRNEVVGLGLAFMGARSITDFVIGMATGAATAERLGNTMGMTTRQVWAWRQAMKGVGGKDPDADAALQSVQRMRMSFQLGQADPAQMGILGRLGITGNDLHNSNPGDILRKLSAAQSRMDPQLFASLLQQIGLNGPVIYFLQQGKGSVDKLLKQYEKSADKQEELAKKTEALQQSMAELNGTIANALVPDLITLIGQLNQVVHLLEMLTGQPTTKDSLPTRVGKDIMGIVTGRPNTRNAWDEAGDALGGRAGELIKRYMGTGNLLGGPTRADRNNNPGNIVDGSFARQQAGYIGNDGRFARFDNAEHGAQAMVNLLLNYMRKGKDTIAGIVSKWAPPSENDTAGYIADVERRTGIGRNQHLTAAQLRLVAAAMARHEGYHGGIKIQHMTVHTKDAGSFSKDLHAKTRRHAVSKADQGVAP